MTVYIAIAAAHSKSKLETLAPAIADAPLIEDDPEKRVQAEADFEAKREFIWREFERRQHKKSMG